MRKNEERKSNTRNKIKLLKKRVKDQGVTMVALVVTIIILLILAGVTIRFVVGEDGIIGQAKQASLKYQNSSLQEQILLNSIDEQIADITNGSSSGSGSGSGSSGGDSSSGDSQETIDELNQKIDDLQRQVDVLKEKLEETEKERDDNESRANNLQEQLNNSEAEKEQLKAQIAELENQINQLNKTISSLQSQIEQLQNEISNLKAKQATGTANASDVIAGKTFSNSSGTGLVGTLISHSAYTSSLSIGVNDDTAYFRIPQGAYVTNTTTGYPEITAKISDINEATGYKYTQAQYDAAYTEGYSAGYTDSENNKVGPINLGPGYDDITYSVKISAGNINWSFSGKSFEKYTTTQYRISVNGTTYASGGWEDRNSHSASGSFTAPAGTMTVWIAGGSNHDMYWSKMTIWR